MARETVFTAIIPAILIFFLVFFNIRKMQKQAKIMKMEHEGQMRRRLCRLRPQQKLSFREEGFIRKKESPQTDFSVSLRCFFYALLPLFCFRARCGSVSLSRGTALLPSGGVKLMAFAPAATVSRMLSCEGPPVAMMGRSG